MYKFDFIAVSVGKPRCFSCLIQRPKMAKQPQAALIEVSKINKTRR